MTIPPMPLIRAESLSYAPEAGLHRRSRKGGVSGRGADAQPEDREMLNDRKGMGKSLLLHAFRKSDLKTIGEGNGAQRPEAVGNIESTSPISYLVRNMDLELYPGEIVGLTGPNGAGKSTLMRLLIGFIKPISGFVRYLDRPVEELTPRERARHAAFMGQKAPDTFPFTVLEIVAMGRYPHEFVGSKRRSGLSSGAGPAPTSTELPAQPGYPPVGVPGDEAAVIGMGTVEQDRLSRKNRSRFGDRGERSAALAALAALDLTHLADRRFTTLSGGEQQLVLFAQILSQDSPALLLDEPTASLDIGHESQLLQKVRDLCHKGKGALIALHNLNSAAEYCDRIILMDRGRMVGSGSPREVFSEINLKRHYHTDVRLGTNEATGSLVVTALPRPAAACRQRIHLIGGAGSAVAATRELYLRGCRITGGVAHEMDSDAKIWASLGIEFVTVQAFDPIDHESLNQAAVLSKQADLTILCSFPIGAGNAANLEAAAAARRLYVLEEKQGWQTRSFFAPHAEEAFNQLLEGGNLIGRGGLRDLITLLETGEP